MLNKKAYMITPLIFVVFMIIAVIFSFYVSDIDKKNAEGIRSAGIIDKGIIEIQKEQINQVNFVKLVTYDCSKTICCNSTNLGNLENCIEQELETIYEQNVVPALEKHITKGSMLKSDGAGPYC